VRAGSDAVMRGAHSQGAEPRCSGGHVPVCSSAPG
jgi:hypothetical protein